MSHATLVAMGSVFPSESVVFFSILTFSWMGPLLCVSHEKTLYLKDVSKLGHSDSVNGFYLVVQNNKLYR